MQKLVLGINRENTNKNSKYHLKLKSRTPTEIINVSDILFPVAVVNQSREEFNILQSKLYLATLKVISLKQNVFTCFGIQGQVNYLILNIDTKYYLKQVFTEASATSEKEELCV